MKSLKKSNCFILTITLLLAFLLTGCNSDNSSLKPSPTIISQSVITPTVTPSSPPTAEPTITPTLTPKTADNNSQIVYITATGKNITEQVANIYHTAK